MKPSFHISLPLMFSFLLCASLLFISCDDDKSNPAGSTGGSEYLTFKVNGTAMDFAQYGPSGFYYSANNQTSIVGRTGGFANPDFSLGFPGKTTGTFTEASGGWVDYTDANGTNYYVEPSTCSITVTQYGEVGGYIVGTFSAVKSDGSNTATINDGRFSVKRTY
jgi:hypothetical protein